MASFVFDRLHTDLEELEVNGFSKVEQVLCSPQSAHVSFGETEHRMVNLSLDGAKS